MFNKLLRELAVCSPNAVRELAKHRPETINRLFLRGDRLPEFGAICKNLAERKRPYKICEDEELERISKTPHHGGIVAMIGEHEAEPLSREDLERWATEGLHGLVLHDVGNDFNLGAIIRQAAFFGINYVVISEQDEAARLSTAAYRAAEGGIEHLSLRSVRRTEAFLHDACKVLLVVGADHRARRRVENLRECIAERRVQTSRNPGIAIILGNEERGLSPEIKAECSVLLRIPGSGLIESLNVAQAAALFCHELYQSY